jgi:hypothetical protein
LEARLAHFEGFFHLEPPGLRLYQRREISVSIEGCWLTVGIDSEGGDGFRGLSGRCPLSNKASTHFILFRIPMSGIKGQPYFLGIK